MYNEHDIAKQLMRSRCLYYRPSSPSPNGKCGSFVAAPLRGLTPSPRFLLTVSLSPLPAHAQHYQVAIQRHPGTHILVGIPMRVHTMTCTRTHTRRGRTYAQAHAQAHALSPHTRTAHEHAYTLQNTPHTYKVTRPDQTRPDSLQCTTMQCTVVHCNQCTTVDYSRLQ